MSVPTPYPYPFSISLPCISIDYFTIPLPNVSPSLSCHDDLFYLLFSTLLNLPPIVGFLYDLKLRHRTPLNWERSDSDRYVFFRSSFCFLFLRVFSCSTFPYVLFLFNFYILRRSPFFSFFLFSYYIDYSLFLFLAHDLL